MCSGVCAGAARCAADVQLNLAQRRVPTRVRAPAKRTDESAKGVSRWPAVQPMPAKGATYLSQAGRRSRSAFCGDRAQATSVGKLCACECGCALRTPRNSERACHLRLQASACICCCTRTCAVVLSRANTASASSQALQRTSGEHPRSWQWHSVLMSKIPARWPQQPTHLQNRSVAAAKARTVFALVQQEVLSFQGPCWGTSVVLRALAQRVYQGLFLGRAWRRRRRGLVRGLACRRKEAVARAACAAACACIACSAAPHCATSGRRRQVVGRAAGAWAQLTQPQSAHWYRQRPAGREQKRAKRPN